jgi:hypothetical protein
VALGPVQVCRKVTRPRRLSRKEAARAALRQIVLKHMEPLVQRMIAAAMGIGHLCKRDATGKFTRVEDEKEIEKLMCDGTEGSHYWIFAKDPSVQAFTDLMNRAIDKPTESVGIEHSGGFIIKHEL